MFISRAAACSHLLSIILLGCTGMNEPAEIYTMPLRQWASHPSVPVEVMPISATRTIRVPAVPSLYRTPFSQRDGANIYFNFDPVSRRLIDGSRIAEYGRYAIIEYEFSQSLDILDVAYDVTGRRRRGLRGPAYKQVWRGTSVASDKPYNWRCSIDASLVDRPRFADCAMILPGATAQAIHISYSARIPAPGGLSKASQEELDALVAEAIAIEKTFTAAGKAS
jgi:hypothetical protein